MPCSFWACLLGWAVASIVSSAATSLFLAPASSAVRAHRPAPPFQEFPGDVRIVRNLLVPLQTSAGLAARVVTCVLHCLSLQHPWNSSLAQGLISRRIALRHWRTPMLPWLALTYTAARLGLEAQNAAAVQLLRLAGGIPKTGADEIVPVPPADTAPAQVAVAPKTRDAAAPKTRHAAKKIHKKSAPGRNRGKRAKRG